MRIDLNCDMGESFGAYTIGDDEAVMRSITSANVACGFHAGDPLVIRRTLRLAQAHGVAAGARSANPSPATGRPSARPAVSRCESGRRPKPTRSGNPGCARVVDRVLRMVRDRVVEATDGSMLSLDVATICVHGDTPGAADLVARLRAGLEAASVTLTAVGAA